MTRTSSKKRVVIAVTALILTAGGALATSGWAAAPSTASRSAPHEQRVWPVPSAGSARHVMREARAEAAEDGGRVVAVLEVVRQFRSVDVGAPGDSPGDLSFFRGALLSLDTLERVGRDTMVCTSALRTTNCEATFQLYGQGTIQVSGAFFGGEPLLPVTGGTRDFRDAGGQMFITDPVRNSSRLVFQLTD